VSGDPGKARVDVVVLTVVPPELEAARRALGLDDRHRQKHDGAVYYRGQLRSELAGRDYQIALGCVGVAGNPGTAAATASAISAFRPRAVLLMGIAAGVRGKVRIGDVILAERVVAYEPAALLRTATGAREQPRPEIDRAPHGMIQDAVAYRADPERLRQAFDRAGGKPVVPPPGRTAEYREHVATAVWPRLGTIASGEKLLRDPAKLLAVRKLHGKVEVGEMEAAGLVDACRRHNLPWLVVRGISDFGDELKDDRFHGLASCAAAAVLVDFLGYGLQLDDGLARPRPAPRPFVFGRALLDDRELVGREHEKRWLRDSLAKRMPVEILGERMVGKSSMLRWVERTTFLDRPVVWLDAAYATTPGALVGAIAASMQRHDVARDLDRSTPGDEAANRLDRLMPLVLLINDVDNLARSGRGFDQDFFERLRALVEGGRLTWVSSSHRDLFSGFKARGLTSRFLNNAQRLHLGGLDDDSVRALAARVGDERIAAQMSAAVGGFAHGLQWLGDFLHRRPGAIEQAIDAFAVESESIFESWWSSLETERQRLLKACCDRAQPCVPAAREARQGLRWLAERGLVRERDGGFAIEPDLWREFVARAD
jgi:nucleoside phosphorylase